MRDHERVLSVCSPKKASCPASGGHYVLLGRPAHCHPHLFLAKISLILGLLMGLGSPVFCESSQIAPFFVTIQKVELKNEAGKWATVIEPDKKVDLAQSEPSVSFFNNGRVLPGRYVNVRVRLDRGVLVRSEDYDKPLNIKKGSFVNVAFSFDLRGQAQGLSQDNFKQIHVTVDEDERTDGGDRITIGG